MSLNPCISHVELMKKCPVSMRKKPSESFDAWRQRAKKRLEEMLGLPLKQEEENFRIEWIDDGHPDHIETRFVFSSEPNVDVLCHMLIPKNIPQKDMPLVICLQGHSKGMHISLGRPRYEGDEDTISKGDRDFAVQIIARGQAALAIEQRGMGERGGTPKPACLFPAMQALMLGRTLIGERCWDVSRVIDTVEKHFPMIDVNRIAIMGQSGGGTTSLYAAALDERITAAMPSCAFSGFLPSVGEKHECACNYVPGLMNEFDMADIAALIAPRPLVLVSGATDDIFPIDSVMEQAQILRELYMQANAPQAFELVIGSEGHRFYAKLGWSAFDKVTGWR